MKRLRDSDGTNKTGRSEKQPRFLVFSEGIVHPSVAARQRLRGILHALDGVDFSFSRDFSGMSRRRFLPAGEVPANGLLLFFHKKAADENAVAALCDFVKDGGGLVVVHAAAASFKTSEAYRELIGCSFETHAKPGPFRLEHSHDEPEPSLFKAHPPVELSDELYRFSFAAGNAVQFTADGEPQVWARYYGRGRVFVFSPGHRSATFLVPEVRRILETGIRWTAGIPAENGTA